MCSKVTRGDLLALYENRLDSATIDMIFDECRGNRSECLHQLELLAGGSSGAGGDDDDEIMRQPTTQSSAEGGIERGSSEYVVDYDAAIADGEDKDRYDREVQQAAQMFEKLDDVAELGQVYLAHKKMEDLQAKLGPQSSRKTTIDVSSMSSSYRLAEHSVRCISTMMDREKEHCGRFAVFYHCYSLAALIYEVNSCIAEVLYGVPDCPPMPRLLKGPFRHRPHIKTLLSSFTSLSGQDHHPNFRAVAISVSCSLTAPQSEAPPIQTFENGYSCGDLSFQDVLTNIFRKMGATEDVSSSLAINCCKIAAKNHYNVQSFELPGSSSRTSERPGHLLQIFVRRDVVDDIAYGSQPYGVFDPSSNPLSAHLAKDVAPMGQARVFWHPSVFLDPMKSVVYHYAANKEAMLSRRQMRDEMIAEIGKSLFNTPGKVIDAFRRVELDAEA